MGDFAGGEFGLIARFYATLAPLPDNSPVVLGIGDDAALLAPTGSAGQTVVTTDLLIEDIHFRRAWADPKRLGRKAVAVNLSDIAAMGASPTATFVSLALPPDLPLAWVDALFAGMREIAGEFGSLIAGGDTNASPDRIVLSVTQMGRAALGKAVRRSGAKPGDLVVVTGGLGAAKAGLDLLERFGLPEAERQNKEAVDAQLSPVPRIAAGQAAARAGASAMMDISDGLLADLAKLCGASRVGATVREADVPVHPAAQNGENALQYALTGGEDYELLVTVPLDHYAFLQNDLREAGAQAFVVGEIRAEAGVTVARPDGSVYRPDVRAGGWNHFGAKARNA